MKILKLKYSNVTIISISKKYNLDRNVIPKIWSGKIVPIDESLVNTIEYKQFF
jgi:hypothetical protein